MEPSVFGSEKPPSFDFPTVYQLCGVKGPQLGSLQGPQFGSPQYPRFGFPQCPQFGCPHCPVLGNQKPTGFPVFSDDPEITAMYSRTRRSWYVDVEGFGTSLPADEMKKALFDHFKSCGSIVRVDVDDSHASIAIIGDDADEKVMELNGSELGGGKLTVKKAKRCPKLIQRDVPFGSCVTGT